jgi:hypothetical protein
MALFSQKGCMEWSIYEWMNEWINGPENVVPKCIYEDIVEPFLAKDKSLSYLWI